MNLCDLPDSHTLILDVIYVTCNCAVLLQAGYITDTCELSPSEVLSSYLEICNTSNVSKSQIRSSVTAITAGYQQLISEFCHEKGVATFSQPWELEKVIHVNETRRNWQPEQLQQLVTCVNIINAHLSNVIHYGSGRQHVMLRACLCYMLMEPCSFRISSIHRKLQQQRLTRNERVPAILEFAPPPWSHATIDTTNMTP